MWLDIGLIERVSQTGLQVASYSGSEMHDHHSIEPVGRGAELSGIDGAKSEYGQSLD